MKDTHGARSIISYKNNKKRFTQCEVEKNYKICFTDANEDINSLENIPENNCPILVSRNEEHSKGINDLSKNFDRASSSVYFVGKNTRGISQEYQNNYSFEKNSLEQRCKIMKNISEENSRSYCFVDKNKGNETSSNTIENDNYVGGMTENVLEKNVPEILEESKDNSPEVSFDHVCVDDENGPYDLQSNPDIISPHLTPKEDMSGLSSDESSGECCHEIAFKTSENKSFRNSPEDKTVEKKIKHNFSEASYSTDTVSYVNTMGNLTDSNSSKSCKKINVPLIERESVTNLHNEKRRYSFDKSYELPIKKTEDICEEFSKRPRIHFSGNLTEDENNLENNNSHLTGNYELGYIAPSQVTQLLSDTAVSNRGTDLSSKTSTTPPLQGRTADKCLEQRCHDIRKDISVYSSECVNAKEVSGTEATCDSSDKKYSEVPQHLNLDEEWRSISPLQDSCDVYIDSEERSCLIGDNCFHNLSGFVETRNISEEQPEWSSSENVFSKPLKSMNTSNKENSNSSLFQDDCTTNIFLAKETKCNSPGRNHSEFSKTFDTTDETNVSDLLHEKHTADYFRQNGYNNKKTIFINPSEFIEFKDFSNVKIKRNSQNESELTKVAPTADKKTSHSLTFQENYTKNISFKEHGCLIHKGIYSKPLEYMDVKDKSKIKPNCDIFEKNLSEHSKVTYSKGIIQKETKFCHRNQLTQIYQDKRVDSNEKLKTTGNRPKLFSQDSQVSDISYDELKTILSSVHTGSTRNSTYPNTQKCSNCSSDTHYTSKSRFISSNVPDSSYSSCLHSTPNTNNMKNFGEMNCYVKANKLITSESVFMPEDTSERSSHRDKEINVSFRDKSKDKNKSVKYISYDGEVIMKNEIDEGTMCIPKDLESKMETNCNKRKLTHEGSFQKCFRRNNYKKFVSIDKTISEQQQTKIFSNEISRNNLDYDPSHSFTTISSSPTENSVLSSNYFTEYTLQKYISRDDLIYRLLEWDVDWLKIQLDTNCLPPIVDDFKEVKMCYKSVEEYYDIFFPLHLLNIWLSLFNSWKKCSNAILYDAKFDDLVENLYYARMSCSSIMTTEEFKNFPTRGGMIIVKFIKRDGNIKNLFGYVDDVGKQTYNAFGGIDVSCRILWNKVKFSFYIAKKPSEYFHKFVKVQNLLNIENLLNQNDALKSLINSSMKEIILNPAVNASKIQLISYSSPSTFQKLQESINKILKCISSTDNQIILVNASSSDRTYAVFRIVKAIVNKHCPVVVCLKDKNTFLMLATYLSEFGLILAVKQSEIAVPDYLEKFLLSEVIAKRMDGCQGKRIPYEIWKDYSIILTTSFSMNFDGISDSFVNGDLVCIFDEANLWHELETLLLLSYNLRTIILMSNSSNQVDMHPFLHKYGYNKSLYRRLYQIKCCM